MRAERPEPPTPRASLSSSTLREELLVVLSLSLLASAAYAILSLLSAPLKGATVAVYPQGASLATQLLDIAFGLAPVWLVLYLVRRNGEGPEGIGLSFDRPLADAAGGAVLVLVVGTVGIAIYLGSVALGVNRYVIPVPLGHWWTVPVLFLGAAQAALLEEIIVVGYLITRLRQIGWSPVATLAASALLRGSYHLYQGWGGFLGNLALGLFFGWNFLRRRRTWPLVVAHFLLDVGAGLGYLAFRSHLPGA
jgi:membrane protease YdiL (CAAX protease family)